MKKNIIRIISGLLLLVMLASCFISCKKEEVIEETDEDEDEDDAELE